MGRVLLREESRGIHLVGFVTSQETEKPSLRFLTSLPASPSAVLGSCAQRMAAMPPVVLNRTDSKAFSYKGSLSAHHSHS